MSSSAPSITLHAKFGASSTTVVVDAEASVRDVKVQLETLGCPAGQQLWLCKGKRITQDDEAVSTVVSDGAKLMLMRAPASTSTIKLNLRDGRARVLTDVEVGITSKVGELRHVAAKAFGEVACPSSAVLYHAECRKVLRDDLSIADYGLSGGTVWVVPTRSALPDSADSPPQPVLAVGLPASFEHVPREMQNVLLKQLEENRDQMPEPLVKALEASIRSSPSELSTSAAADKDAKVPTTFRTGFVPGARAQLPPMPAGMFEQLLVSTPGPEGAMKDGAAVCAGFGTSACAPPAEHVEECCARLVDSFAPVLAAESSAAREEEKRESSKGSFGSGLKRGFLTARPKRRRTKIEDSRTGVAPDSKIADGGLVRSSVPLPLSAAAAAASAVSEGERQCPSPPKVSRPACFCCQRRLPLVASSACRCKCGHMFCATHMHEHSCTFDYKAIQRRQLAVANPLIKVSKLDAI